MVKVDNLVKYYGEHCAVRNISFTVEEGQVYGLLGSNGAGKSTIMNIMTGYISATSGSVSINGFDILTQPLQAKAQVGYMPEIPPLYMDQTVQEYLDFVARLRRVPKAECAKQVSHAMERTDIVSVRNRLIKALSKGYRQRVGLASVLIGSPKLIILDEPTAGLDPNQVIEVRNLIGELRKDHTIILSSHILSEVEAVCDQVLIINKGQLVAMGAPGELAKRAGEEKALRITAMGDAQRIKAACCSVSGVTHCQIAEQKQDSVSVDVYGQDIAALRAAVSEALMNAGCPIIGMQMSSTSMEEIFLQLTGGGQQPAGKEETT